MFDIGFSELFVIAIVALLVLGPERLPKAARFTGLWVRRARAQWYSVKSELEDELADDELKRSLQQARDQLQGEMRDLRDGLQQGAQTVQDGFGTVTRPPATAAGSGASGVNGGQPQSERAADEAAPAAAGRVPDSAVSQRDEAADPEHPAATRPSDDAPPDRVGPDDHRHDRR